MALTRSPYRVLADRLAADVKILEQADAILQKYRKTRAEKTFPAKLKAAAKVRGPKQATNGSGRIIPVSRPTNLTPDQLRSIDSYLIHQIVSKADGPILLDDVLASLRAAHRPAKPMMVAAQLRLGTLKRGPGFSQKNRVYVAGKPPAAFADYSS